MPQPQIIEPETAHERVQQDDAVLVCAYDDREKCGDVPVPAAITLPELEQRADQLDRVRELIFYCN